MNPYRRRVLEIVDGLVRPLGPVPTALDFGSGDGWFPQQFEETGLVRQVTPVDVQERKQSVRPPVVYDGVRLPFADRSFDLSFTADVLHHCPDPAASLRDLLRVTDKWFVLKDHTWKSYPSYLFLCLLDEIGNRRFGVPCLYKHQRGWSWFDVLRGEGFELVQLVHPAPCHTGLMRWVNRHEFVALWRRAGA